jgi:hypothetical protein
VNRHWSLGFEDFEMLGARSWMGMENNGEETMESFALARGHRMLGDWGQKCFRFGALHKDKS